MMTAPTINASDRLHLPNFQAALDRYPEQPSDATSWRWRNGFVPAIIHFLIEHPDLIEALMADAQERKQNGTV